MACGFMTNLGAQRPCSDSDALLLQIGVEVVEKAFRSPWHLETATAVGLSEEMRQRSFECDPGTSGEKLM